MTTAHVTWSTVKRLMLQQGPQIEPECAEAVKAVIPDGSARHAEVGFPLAASLLDIYQYRYQSIEAFRVSRHGWPGFFPGPEDRSRTSRACDDPLLGLAVHRPYRREPTSCTCLPVQATISVIGEGRQFQIRKDLPPPSVHHRGDDANLTSRQG
jgi:hypothetical protein